MINPEKLTFKHLIMTIGNLPSSYVESLSYYECLLWLCNYLEKTVIPAVNNNGEAVTELQNLFIQLQNYVEHYFDNLDLQDKVNNKLDEMVEDGTFDKIINQELFSQLDSEVNDSNYYDINYTTGRKYDTDYYVTVIPKQINDEDIPISVNMDTTKTPLQYAQANYTTVTTNAGITYQNSQEVWKQNLVIGNGEILNPVPIDITLPNFYTFLGFDDERNVYEYQANTLTAQQALNDGVKNGYVVFYRYMNNGVIETHEEAGNWNVASPRLDLGIKANGDLVILVADGYTDNNVGLTNVQALEIMQEYNCVKAWRCDGGGSVSLNYKGSKINRNIDENATKDRKIDVTLNVKKPTINDERADIYSYIGRDRQLLNKQIRDDIYTSYTNRIDNLHANLTLFNWTGNSNPMSASDTWQTLKFQDGLRKGTVVTAVAEDNKVVGFKINRPTIVKVTISCTVAGVNTAGNRALSLRDSTNTLVNYSSMFIDYKTPHAYQDSLGLTAVFVFNNRNAGSEYKIQGFGVEGDSFDKMTCCIEVLGSAT